MAAAPPLTVQDLLAERDARHRHEQEVERDLKRKSDEQLAEFRQRLETFEITDHHRQMIQNKIRQAFDQGENEIMFASFPSSFCTDSGRAIINAGQPPINPPATSDSERDPEWVETLPAGFRKVYDLWKQNLKPGGFHFGARIITFPGGKPGDVGLFFSWATEKQLH